MTGALGTPMIGACSSVPSWAGAVFARVDAAADAAAAFGMISLAVTRMLPGAPMVSVTDVAWSCSFIFFTRLRCWVSSNDSALPESVSPTLTVSAISPPGEMGGAGGGKGGGGEGAG